MSRTRNNIITLFVAASLLSAFAYNLFILRETNYSVSDVMTKLCNLQTDTKFMVVLTYVFLKRLKQILVIYVLLRAFKPEPVIEIIAIAFGVFTGMMITAQVYLNGLGGLAMLILCFVPHYPAYIYLIKNLYNINKLTHKDKAFWGYFLMSISIFCIGVLCECYFSIFFLKGFYQHIVM